MRICIVGQPFDSFLSQWQTSIGIWTTNVASRLPEACKVEVLAPRHAGQPAGAVRDDVRYAFLPHSGPRLWRRLERFGTREFPAVVRPWYYLDYRRGVFARLRSQKPDIVHLQNLPSYVEGVRRALPQSRIVLHMHGEWLSQLDRRAMMAAIVASDVVVGCSRYLLDRIAERFPDVEDKLRVLPNGVEPPSDVDVGRPEQSKSVLFVGRLSPEKGVHDLISAFDIVADDIADARLSIVGPDAQIPRELIVDLDPCPKVQALSRFYDASRSDGLSYAQRLQRDLPERLRGRVRFVGGLNHGQALDCYRDAGVLANLSLSESFGMSLVEAMAYGVPVLAAETGGMTEVVKATGGGVLTPSADPAAQAVALRELLLEPESRKRFGSAGRTEVKKLYSWSAVADKTMHLYQDL